MADIISTCSFTGDKGTPSGGGGFYTSISAWVTAQAQDLTVGNTAILECYGDFVGGLDDLVDVRAFTTDPTNKIIIRAAAGEEAVLGNNNQIVSGFYLKSNSATNTQAIINVDRDMDIVGIGIISENTFACAQINVGFEGDKFLDSVIAINTNTGADGRAFRFASNVGDCNFTLRNCYGISMATSGLNGYGIAVIAQNAATIQRLESCTFINHSAASAPVYFGNSSQIKCENVVAYRPSGPDGFSGTYGTDVGNNASGDATAPGPSPQHNIDSSAFVDEANLNFRPVAGGVLDGAGADLSGSFTDDIEGTTRTVPWDIGAWVKVAAGSVTFDGPNIVNQTGTENQVFTFDENGQGTVASRFTGASSYSLSPLSDPLPAGLSVNPTTGNIEGTPTVNGTFPNIIVRGSS